MATITWSPQLTMDSVLAARIITAIRAFYPDLVSADMTDAQVARVWVKRQVRELLANYAIQGADPHPTETARAAADAVWTQIQAAGDSARNEVENGVTT